MMQNYIPIKYFVHYSHANEANLLKVIIFVDYISTATLLTPQLTETYVTH